jgi:hypothetical protein
VIISHTHKYIFIKSEKTASTSIDAALSRYCNGADVVTPLGDYWFNRNEKGEWIHRAMNCDGFNQHDPASEVKRKLPPEVWNRYLKFSIARNPWDRLVSWFTWEARNKPSLKPQQRLHHRVGVPFREFAETRKIFKQFLKGDWQTNDRFYILDGALCVDFIIRYERLTEDFDALCKRIGLPKIELPQLKSGIRPGGRHYSEYYDEESQALVAQRHANDIRLFGYQFERQ